MPVKNRHKSMSGEKRRKTTRKKKSMSSRKRNKTNKKRSSKNIKIVGYSWKTGSEKKTKIISSCIEKQKRLSTKGPKLIKITELGVLRKFGYNTHITDNKRHSALNKAVKEYGELKVLHRVNAIRTLQKSHLDTWKALDNDVKYLENKYFPNRKGAQNSNAKPYTAKEIASRKKSSKRTTKRLTKK
jgi:hypothetical protein